MPIVQRQFFEKQEYWKEAKGRPKDRETLTDVFLEAQKEHPEVKDFQPMMHSMTVIGAGTESTYAYFPKTIQSTDEQLCRATTISSIFYYLLKNKGCYLKLQNELDNLECSKIPVSFSEAQKLPYLNAVIDEAMRCHWISRLPQPRDTPKDGLHICGHWIPSGVAVSTYGTVLHHRKEVFGEDIYIFRPERWLEEKDRVQRMRNSRFSFGSGKYSCLGRHLAMLMILKFVPSILREFDVRLPSSCGLSILFS